MCSKVVEVAFLPDKETHIYPYYGTADATILYLIVLSETYRWTGDLNLLKEYRQVAGNCLNWIDHYGDLDGDGFQEYKTYSSLGYENIGWKDAGNASCMLMAVR